MTALIHQYVVFKVYPLSVIDSQVKQMEQADIIKSECSSRKDEHPQNSFKYVFCAKPEKKNGSLVTSMIFDTSVNIDVFG